MSESDSLASLLGIIQSHPASRVVLMGPQGAGKTTLGKMAGDVLGYPWYDSDALILARFHDQYGKAAAEDIAAVYRALGWWRFRYWENQVVKQLLGAPSPCIISLGGATHVYAPACRLLCRQSVVVGINRFASTTWGVFFRVQIMRYYANHLLGCVGGRVSTWL